MIVEISRESDQEDTVREQEKRTDRRTQKRKNESGSFHEQQPVWLLVTRLIAVKVIMQNQSASSPVWCHILDNDEFSATFHRDPWCELSLKKENNK